MKESDLQVQVADYLRLQYPDACYKFGLFIELKKDGTRLKKKNGDWANDHIAEQALVLEELQKRGYTAEFAVGFDQAKELIDKYLGVTKDGME